MARYEKCAMTALHDALDKYVALHRALDTQLREPALTLQHFVEFLDREAPSPLPRNSPCVGLVNRPPSNRLHGLDG